MTSHRITDPAVLPVTVDDMRAHLRLPTTDEDALLTEYIQAAVAHVERVCRRALISQGWRIFLDAWPISRTVRLSVSPVISIDRITVYDSSGTPQDLDPADWQLERGSEPQRVRVEPGAGPSTTLINGVEIDFTAGYGTAAFDVPDPLCQAVRLLAAFWFEHREAGSVDEVTSLPHGFDHLLSAFKVPLL